MINKVFIDLDGILANFTKSAFALFGQKEPETYPEESWIASVLGITEEEFWVKIDYGFWRNMEPMKDMDAILSTIQKYVPIEKCCILTSPSLHGAGAHGKMDWIMHYLPEFERRFLIGACKEMCAYPGNVLIDDLEKNVDLFNKHGGAGILVPRPWNVYRMLAEDSVGYLDGYLKNLMSK